LRQSDSGVESTPEGANKNQNSGRSSKEPKGNLHLDDYSPGKGKYQWLIQPKQLSANQKN
jgi:hypothetical protein